MRCAVFGCQSRNNKTDFPGVQFFSFPKCKLTRKLWILACGRQDVFKADNARVCSEHFGPDDFVRNLKHELLNYCPKTYRPLKKDVVPSIGIPKKERKTETAEMITKKQNKELVEQIRKQSCTNQNSTGASDMFENDCPSTSKSVGTNTEGSYSTLLDELRRLKKQNLDLIKEHSFLKLEHEAFAKLYTKNQLKKIVAPLVKVQWNNEEIAEAVRLFSAGPNAYRMLLSKGYPYPAESTLRSFKKKFVVVVVD